MQSKQLLLILPFRAIIKLLSNKIAKMKKQIISLVASLVLLVGLALPQPSMVEDPVYPTADSLPINSFKDDSATNNIPSTILQNSKPSIITPDSVEQYVPNNIGNVTKELRQELIGKTVTDKFGQELVVKKYETALVPNDPLVNQWWESSFKVNNIWAVPNNSSNQTVIAIIDTGFALNHQEFAGRWFTNSGEVGATVQEAANILNCTDRGLPLDASCNNIDDDNDGILDNESGYTPYQNPSRLNCTSQGRPLDKSCNNIDDDNNGYIDDVNGWDFVNQDPSVQAGQLNPSGTGIRHGTMVAGFAAASGNNGVGIAGVDWYSKILPLQAIDDDSIGNSITVGQAIRYAADIGANVINLSLGTTGPDNYILQAIEYAYDKGSIVVAAAGNDGCDCMIYPGNYDLPITVGALDSTGNRASFSSYGAVLDVMAPGQTITSPTFTTTNGTNAYATGSGTSFATPIISGLVARLKNRLPNATPAQITALITEQTTQIKSGIFNKTNDKGWGHASAANSISRATTPKNFTQLHAFDGVQNGGIFYGTKQTTIAYACEPGAYGTTTLLKGSKTGSNFYSINPIDTRRAPSQGYALQTMFNTCVLQPHDTVQAMRWLQTATEFDNISTKSLLIK
jgi:subtilisin family serine protease